MTATSPPPWEPRPQFSGYAIASLILAIIGLFIGWCTFGIPAMVATVLGLVGIGKTRNGRGRGFGMAVTGTTLGIFVSVLSLIFGAFWIKASDDYQKRVDEMGRPSSRPHVTSSVTPR